VESESICGTSGECIRGSQIWSSTYMCCITKTAVVRKVYVMMMMMHILPPLTEHVKKGQSDASNLTWPWLVCSSGTCWWTMRRKLWFVKWSRCPSVDRWSSAAAASVGELCSTGRWSEAGTELRWSESQRPANRDTRRMITALHATWLRSENMSFRGHRGHGSSSEEPELEIFGLKTLEMEGHEVKISKKDQAEDRGWSNEAESETRERCVRVQSRCKWCRREGRDVYLHGNYLFSLMLKTAARVAMWAPESNSTLLQRPFPAARQPAQITLLVMEQSGPAQAYSHLRIQLL